MLFMTRFKGKSNAVLPAIENEVCQFSIYTPTYTKFVRMLYLLKVSGLYKKR